MLSTNSGNYVLTKDGVISKLDCYWDKLQVITVRLEALSGVMQKKLLYSYLASGLLVGLVYFTNLEAVVSLLALGLVCLSSFSMAMAQIIRFLEFLDLKKKGLVLYQELEQEVVWNLENEYLEDISIEDRISLNSFLLAAQMPIPPYLYAALVSLLPLITLFCAIFYFW